MSWMFFRVYLGVIAVLLAAWYIHGVVLERRSQAELERVVLTAHGGGARVVAHELDAVEDGTRNAALAQLRSRFDYDVVVLPRQELPSVEQQELADGQDVIYWNKQNRVVAALANQREVVCLGPLPDYTGAEVEAGLRGWMRLTADRLNEVSASERDDVLQELQGGFDIPISIVRSKSLPDQPRRRIERGADPVLYESSAQSGQWYAVTPLEESQLVRFGPFPRFERIDQQVAATTLAFVLLPAALAILVLLRPLANQLRRVEQAAKSIAEGDLSARVDVRKAGSARQLATAFNEMAGRTEVIVRTQRDLLQAVSHELRTPLAKIRFATDLVESATDAQDRADRLHSLESATDELDGLVTELLEYVRLESSQPNLKRELVEVAPTLGELLPTCAHLFPQVKVDLSPSNCEGATVYADPRSLQRAIGNLLSNACRFAKQRVRLTITPQGRNVVVDVDDDGPGISTEDRHRVLEPFVQLDREEHQPKGGVGLGLAIVRRIISQHGGQVEISTSPFGGCRIRTSWPAEPHVSTAG